MCIYSLRFDKWTRHWCAEMDLKHFKVTKQFFHESKESPSFQSQALMFSKNVKGGCAGYWILGMDFPLGGCISIGSDRE